MFKRKPVEQPVPPTPVEEFVVAYASLKSMVREVYKLNSKIKAIDEHYKSETGGTCIVDAKEKVLENTPYRLLSYGEISTVKGELQTFRIFANHHWGTMTRIPFDSVVAHTKKLSPSGFINGSINEYVKETIGGQLPPDFRINRKGMTKFIAGRSEEVDEWQEILLEEDNVEKMTATAQFHLVNVTGLRDELEGYYKLLLEDNDQSEATEDEDKDDEYYRKLAQL